MSATPHFVFSDEMVERAAQAVAATFGACDNHTARAALEAAFEGVPATNYGIGLALQFFDLVICVKDRRHSPATGVYRKNADPHGFDAVPHHVDVSWQDKPTRYVKRVAVSQLAEPAPSEAQR